MTIPRPDAILKMGRIPEALSLDYFVAYRYCFDWGESIWDIFDPRYTSKLVLIPPFSSVVPLPEMCSWKGQIEIVLGLYAFTLYRTLYISDLLSANGAQTGINIRNYAKGSSHHWESFISLSKSTLGCWGRHRHDQSRFKCISSWFRRAHGNAWRPLSLPQLAGGARSQGIETVPW